MGVSVSFPAPKSAFQSKIGRKKENFAWAQWNYTITGTLTQPIIIMCCLLPLTRVEEHTYMHSTWKAEDSLGYWARPRLNWKKKGREREKKTEKKREEREGKCGGNEKERPSEPRGIRNFSPLSVWGWRCNPSRNTSLQCCKNKTKLKLKNRGNQISVDSKPASQVYIESSRIDRVTQNNPVSK